MTTTTATRRLLIACALLGLGLGSAACAGDGEDEIELLEGFEPTPPGPGEIQIVSPIVRDIPAGADVTMCTYLPLSFSFDEARDVVAALGYQSEGGHHGILYLARDERPVDSHECTDDDMVNATYVAGAGGGEAGGNSNNYIPEGITFRIEAGRQFFVQNHFINTLDHPIDAQSAFTLKVQPVSDDLMPAQLFVWVTTEIELAPEAPGAAGTACVFDEDMQFFLVGGHAHEWGTQVTLTHTPADGEPQVFYDEEWSAPYASDPPRMPFTVEDPMVVHAGDTLSVDCSFYNDTGDMLRFPREMCGGFGYYFPADRERHCVDGIWED